jgi:hypothetical protein
MQAKLKYANTCATNLKPVCMVSGSVDGKGHEEGDLSVKILLITLGDFFVVFEVTRSPLRSGMQCHFGIRGLKPKHYGRAKNFFVL